MRLRIVLARPKDIRGSFRLAGERPAFGDAGASLRKSEMRNRWFPEREIAHRSPWVVTDKTNTTDVTEM